MAIFPTHHCVTGSMRRIYEFYGHPISEEMLLGLGAGVGFVYWHMKGTDPFFGGRANTGRPGEEGLERTAARRTGVKVEIFHTDNAAKAEKTLLDQLCAGQPVMLQVDMGYLPYFDFPEEYHFGGHLVAAVGYDPASRQVLVADRDTQLHPVPLADLARARSSAFRPFAPRHTWYAYDFGEAHPPRAEDILQSMREVCAGMLEPPITNLGVQGIRKAAQRARKWPESMSADELRRACFNVFIFIDATGGSGGGIFRYMYARFLREAAQVTGEERLTGVSRKLHEAGDAWQRVAAAFRGASEAGDPAALLPAAVADLPAIAALEQSAWEELRALVGA